MSILAHRAAMVVTALSVIAIAACSQSGPTTASTTPTTQITRPTATPNTPVAGTTKKSTAGALTDAETLWLASFNRMETTLGESLGKGPETLTRASTLAMADALRDCSRTLTRLGAPGQRLQPVYRLGRQECAAFDRTVPCLMTLADMDTSSLVGSAAERKFSETTDCVAAGLRDGGVFMMNAMNKSIEIRSASGDM